MTNEEREKNIRIANVLIGAINDLIRPILMYQIEKDVTKEALENYIKMLEQQPCEDCISRKAVLDKKELVELEDGQSFYCINPEDVETLPSVTPQQTSWISVSERLPEKDEVVLITNKWHEVDKALYIGGEMFDIIINYLQKEEVIAWMPLPEPYKAESEGEE